MKDRFELIYSLILIGSPVIVFLIYIMNGHVAGVDSWYHVSYVFLDPIVANLFGLSMLGLTILLFSTIPNKRKEWYFISAIFLSGLYITRLLKPEADDYLFQIIAFTLVTIFKISPIGKINHKIISYLFVGAYITLHNSIALGSIGTTEVLRVWYIVATLTLPLYFMYKNNLKKDALIIGLVAVIFAVPKIVYTAVPILILASLLDLVPKKKLNYNKVFVILLGIVSLIAIFNTLSFIPDNEEALKQYCDPITRVCDNHEYGTQYFGHYFAQQGYTSNGTREFGVCSCRGGECVNITLGKPSRLRCGNTFIEVNV